MLREKQTLLNAQFGEVKPGRYYESSKKRLLAKVGAVAGALALASSAMAAQPNRASTSSSQLQEVGVFEPLLLSNNLQQSEQIAQMIKEADFNSAEIRENYVQWEAGNVENDWPAFCNAAIAAEDNGLHEYVTFQEYYTQSDPHSKINGGRGFMPTSLTDYRKFNTTMTTYLYGLAGPAYTGNDKVAHRCSGLKTAVTNVEFNFYNEPNDPDFTTQQTDAQGNSLIPQELVSLYAYEYPRLKAVAKKLGVNLNIAIEAGNPTINNINFINAIGAAIQAQHIKGRIADEWDAHLYTPGGTPLTVHPNAADIGPSDIPMLSAALNQAFGYKLNIIGGEAGVQTFVPADMLNLYEKEDTSQPTTDETGQGQYYSQFLGVLSCAPEAWGSSANQIVGTYNMHLIDDFTGRPWALSGFYYPPANSRNTLAADDNNVQYTNLTPKSDLPVIEQANQAALNGTITCPTNK